MCCGAIRRKDIIPQDYDSYVQKLKQKKEVVLMIVGLALAIFGLIGLFCLIPVGTLTFTVFTALGVLLFVAGAIMKGVINCNTRRPKH
jgi:uncharacterized membrane protein HdeD (DUF308 family)